MINPNFSNKLTIQISLNREEFYVTQHSLEPFVWIDPGVEQNVKILRSKIVSNQLFVF